MVSVAKVKYFYALALLGGAALILLYVFNFARNGEIPIKGAIFYRQKNAPAFWFFTALFSVLGLSGLVGAIAILLVTP